jgi:dTDP-4-amino-4,6-dideoxygalactose transaminase
MTKLAVMGGDPIREETYPSWPVFDERDFEVVINTIKSGYWGGYPYPGMNTKEFAEKFSEMQGGGHAVLMMNGTVTLEVALRAAGIGWGDEVIVPAYTFQATAAAPLAAGAIPVLVDVSPDSLCVDPVCVEAAITDRTKAIMVVHLAAQMTDMDAIMEIAKKHNLIVIEDSAHAHGAQWRGMGAGTIGDFGSFSLQSSKILTTGEGGVLLCKDPEMAERAASIIDCGRPKDAQGMKPTMGYNYRWSEIHAALGLMALARFPEQMNQRISMINYLEESLSEVNGISLLKRDLRHTRRSFYRYIINIDPEYYGCEHDVFCYAMNGEGIPVETGYPAMHRYELFQPGLSKLPVPSAFPEYFDFEKMSFPVTERAGERESVWLDENIFRAGQQGVDDLVSALNKMGQNRDGLSELEAQYQESKLDPEI